MMKKYLIFFAVTVLHLLAIGVIIYSFSPIAKWYFDYRPIWGVDFYNTVTFVQFLKENPSFPPTGWLYSLFGGFPLLSGYPLLHFYLILPLTRFFDLVFSVQLWSVIATGLFVTGAYFLFFVLCRNFILASLLAIAAAFSAGVYQAITWAGSVPAFATQTFFPWVLVFIVLYQRSENFRHLLAAAFLAGLSLWGHQQIFIVYILPAVAIIILFDFGKGLKILGKIKNLVIFGLLAGLIGFPFIYPALVNIGGSLKGVVAQGYSGALSTTTVPSQTLADIAKFNQLQVQRIITDNNLTPFVLAGITAILFGISLVITRKIRLLIAVTPYVLLAGYFAFYIWLFGQGISIFHGGWYRLFWSVPVWVGMMAAIFWYQAVTALAGFLKTKIFKIFLFAITNLAITFSGVLFLLANPPSTTISRIIYRSQASSAHPDILNVDVAEEEQQLLASKLIPSWLGGNDTNYRIYDGDQTVNIWWNSFFKMPLSRGYLDPPTTRGFIFWLDAALSETTGEPQLVKSFQYPVETAISNAQFLVDWYGIRYYEGGHTGDSYTPFPNYLKQLLVKNESVLDLNQKKYTKRPVTLNYSEIKDEATSPILAATNAPTLGIFATEQGFETVIRSIAERGNLNSQRLIPVKLGQIIDNYNISTLKKFDALYLYDYDYKNFDKAFKKLTEYVTSGKKVFVETGVEVRQSSGTLSDFFPVKKVERQGLGRNWELENPGQFGQGVDFSKFSPPVFDEYEWKMSYAAESEIRDGAQVFLKNHGKIVGASQKIGAGEVIWSGVNLAYHITRNHNQEEAKFFHNLLATVVDLNPKPVPVYSAEFKNAKERVITTEEAARGILFKEQAYPGWKAKVTKSENGETRKLTIFKAGPATPGFIYLPTKNLGKITVELKYSGSLINQILVLISVISALMIFEEVAFKGIFFGRLIRKAWNKLFEKVSRWWEREEEE